MATTTNAAAPRDAKLWTKFTKPPIEDKFGFATEINPKATSSTAARSRTAVRDAEADPAFEIANEEFGSYNAKAS